MHMLIKLHVQNAHLSEEEIFLARFYRKLDEEADGINNVRYN